MEKCSACGMELKLGWVEYHPYAFCVLVKQGIDPWELVEKAHKRKAALEALGLKG